MKQTSQNNSSTFARYVWWALIPAGFVLSVLLGIALMFWREYGSSLFQMPQHRRHEAYDLMVQATLGPLYIGLVFLFPITVPVLALVGIVIFLGVLLKRVWLVAIGFVLFSLYWLWLVKLVGDGALD